MRVEVEYVVDDDLSEAPRDAELLRAVIAATVGSEPGHPPGRYRLTLHLVSDDTIHELNREHRDKDAPTDVLSFGLHDPTGMRFVLPPNQPIELGDVVVSYQRMLAQAEEYGHPPARELAYLVVHGTLHILGHDHEDERQRQRMRAREEEVLAPFGLTR